MADGDRQRSVRSPSSRAERLVALFAVAFLLLNYPLLSLFAGDALAFGIPVLYLYLFLAWAGVIALTGWIMSRRHRH
ncbi:hypothetical protein QWY84_08380 [Aquisalimonas lutea]|uniref:hypothetical protein n=1 Tax=Aquisalimonas lutea TaxID=1327750 RepID=UPI0025B403EF|nr:hypothetical protein [Aquisalimonas lutea]MDN3517622.1 hypothetical protein [Aquisalimonas lutea]